LEEFICPLQNGKTFKGAGSTIKAAKVAAAEHAIRKSALTMHNRISKQPTPKKRKKTSSAGARNEKKLA
jgi:hypothetical protein